MKTAPITPADIGSGGATLGAGDALHRNGLPARWAGRERFVVLRTGFCPGHDFLATWDAWRRDPQRCGHLVFISIEKHPPTQAALSQAHTTSPWPELAAALIAAWPPATPNLHVVDFEGGHVRLLLGLGDATRLLPQVMTTVDALWLAGTLANTSPGGEPVAWDTRLLKQLGRLCAPGAIATSRSIDLTLHAGLATAGFQVDAASNGITLARHAPRHRPAPLPGGLHVHDGPREALVIGAGLAGCAAAWGLARQGWQVRVLDCEAAAAQATSGNPVGLFHGAVHAADGPHARLHRAASLRAASVLRPWIASGRVRGQIDGLLRLEAETPAPHAGACASGHAEWLEAAEARRRTGVAVPDGGWWFRDGGWVVPGDFARALLEDSGARFIGGAVVAGIERIDTRWHAFDASGRSLADAPVLVLANALQIPALLGGAMADALGSLSSVRGQLTAVPAAGLPCARVPIGGSGYAVPALDGLLWCGATSQDGDADPTLRESDHRHNLAQLAHLLGVPPLADHATADLPGRVAWRAVTPDRLPWVGALPDLGAFERAPRADRVRFVPRLRDAQGGLHVLGALGSRGITWAVLCGELLASWISGSPCPVEADLRDSLDPARALVARRRHQPSSKDSDS